MTGIRWMFSCQSKDLKRVEIEVGLKTDRLEDLLRERMFLESSHLSFRLDLESIRERIEICLGHRVNAIGRWERCRSAWCRWRSHSVWSPIDRLRKSTHWSSVRSANVFRRILWPAMSEPLLWHRCLHHYGRRHFDHRERVLRGVTWERSFPCER